MKNKALITALFLAAALCSCSRKPAPQAQAALFPQVEIPAMVTEPAARAEYAAKNFWNRFFQMSGATDTSATNGVANLEMEKAMSTYITLLDNFDKETGKACIADLFSRIEAKQAEDTSSHIFPVMTDLVIKYLYDPNSPFRDEDLYLPFVSAMAESEYTLDDARPGYEFEKRMCSLNQYGTPVPDFTYTDKRGARHRLYDVKADNILLFFSNPGCNACKDIVEALEDIRGIHSLIAEKKLAVVNIYIDNEIDKWKEFVVNYPSDWIAGYDQDFIIREDVLYNVRAIPSLYMLDAEKRVVLKDAPTEKAVAYIEKINN